jgi:hypothetical protein
MMCPIYTQERKGVTRVDVEQAEVSWIACEWRLWRAAAVGALAPLQESGVTPP